MRNKPGLLVVTASLFGLCAGTAAQNDQAKGKSAAVPAGQKEQAQPENRQEGIDDQRLRETRERVTGEDREKTSEEARTRAADAESNGSEQGQAMRERRDERKQIMEEAREGGDQAAEAEAGDTGEEKPKKHWCGFWGD